MLLRNIKKENACVENQTLLQLEEAKGSVGIVDGEGFINLNAILSPAEQTVFFEQFCENEKLNTKHLREVYQKEKYKAKHIEMLLITALALIGAGFFIAPLLVVSPIILPIFPVLLVGFAIIALTKFYFNLRLNPIETNRRQAETFLHDVRDSNRNEVDINAVVNGQTQELRTTNELTKELNTKIVTLAENVDMLAKTTYRFFGSKPKPIPEDAANEFHDKERTSDLQP